MMGGCIGAFGRFRLPRNATKVGKMVLSSVLSLRKRAAETMGCGAALGMVVFRTRMSWQKGANGLVAALRGGGPRCRTRVL